MTTSRNMILKVISIVLVIAVFFAFSAIPMATYADTTDGTDETVTTEGDGTEGESTEGENTEVENPEGENTEGEGTTEEEKTTETIYVMTSYAVGGDSMVNYVYNAKGLLTKIKYPGDSDYCKVSYNKKNQAVNYGAKIGKFWFMQKYTYNKKGKLVKDVSYKSKKFAGKKVKKGNTLVMKYNAKGLLTKEIYSGKFYSFKKGKLVKAKFATVYTNKNGRMVKKVMNYPGMKSTNTMKYDAQGNLIKAVTKTAQMGTVTTNYKLTYNDNGLVTKKVEKYSNGGKSKYTYKYKAMEVPKEVASIVKAQQYAFLNEAYAWNTVFPQNFFGN